MQHHYWKKELYIEKIHLYVKSILALLYSGSGMLKQSIWEQSMLSSSLIKPPQPPTMFRETPPLTHAMIFLYLCHYTLLWGPLKLCHVKVGLAWCFLVRHKRAYYINSGSGDLSRFICRVGRTKREESSASIFGSCVWGTNKTIKLSYMLIWH